MKARIKYTGEIIEISNSNIEYELALGFIRDKNGTRYHTSEIETLKIDWEQRRYEIAKEMVSAMWLDDGQAERENKKDGGLEFEYKTFKNIAKEAVEMADALIVELKK